MYTTYKAILSSFLLRGSLFLHPLKLGHLLTCFDQPNAAGHCVTSKSRPPEVLQFLFSPSCCPLKNEKPHGERETQPTARQHQPPDMCWRAPWATSPGEPPEACSHVSDHSQTSKRTASLILAQMPIHRINSLLVTVN